jgi:hypothetical protein
MRIRNFLRLGVEGEQPDPAAAATEDVDLDSLDLESTEQSAAPEQESTETPQESSADRRARELESQLETERAARRAIEQTRPAPAAQPAADTEYEREEAEIRRLEASGATQDQIGWARWKIGVDRSNRQTQRTAEQLRNEARDLSDKGSFERLEVTNPKLYKRYSTRVEEAYQQAAKSGQPVSRTIILKLMLGDDFLSGKVKSKTQAKEAPAAPAKQVDRGRSPGMVRSDVQSRTTNRNDSAKLRERLSNKLI